MLVWARSAKPSSAALPVSPLVATRIEEVVFELAALLLALDGLAEEQRHALERHVLERARGAVPQLEHVHAGDDLDDRRDALVVPLRAVRLLHEGVDALGGQVDAEAREDRGRAAPVGHLGEREDLRQRELRQRLGHVQAAAGGDALHDDVGVGGSRGVEAAGVSVGGGRHRRSLRAGCV